MAWGLAGSRSLVSGGMQVTLCDPIWHSALTLTFKVINSHKQSGFWYTLYYTYCTSIMLSHWFYIPYFLHTTRD